MILYMFTRVIESFERIVSLYAQQLPLNETQCFVTPSLTLITELVSTSHHALDQNLCHAYQNLSFPT